MTHHKTKSKDNLKAVQDLAKMADHFDQQLKTQEAMEESIIEIKTYDGNFCISFWHKKMSSSVTVIRMDGKVFTKQEAQQVAKRLKRMWGHLMDDLYLDTKEKIEAFKNSFILEVETDHE